MAQTLALAFTGVFQDPVSAGYSLGNGYRFFHPPLMRFVAPDDASPFGPGGPNPYAYGGDDPINKIDPTGHAPISDIEEMTKTIESLWDLGYESRDKFFEAKRPDYMLDRKHDVENISALLKSMGHPLKSLDEFKARISAGHVVVQAHGTPGTIQGHSAFFFQDQMSGLELLPSQEGRDAPYRAMYPYGYDWATISAGPGLPELIKSPYTVGKYNHLIEVGDMHVLDQRYTAQFETAFVDERAFFVKQPYSFGEHYNCHTFVRKTLQRLLDLTP